MNRGIYQTFGTRNNCPQAVSRRESVGRGGGRKDFGVFGCTFLPRRCVRSGGKPGGLHWGKKIDEVIAHSRLKNLT